MDAAPVLMKRAEAGAALLDEKKPGWANKIDTGSLNMATVAQCVLGQLYGDYDEGLDALDIWHAKATLGFELGGLSWNLWPTLTYTWIRLIEDRRVVECDTPT